MKIKSHSGRFRHNQAYSGIFRHIQTYSVIIRQIQTYSEIIQVYSGRWYIQNPGIFKTRGMFRTLVYPKLWHIQNYRHIQNTGLFRTHGYSGSEACSKPGEISTMECFEKQLRIIIIVAS